MTPVLSVLIADDHAPTRADLRLALDEDPRFSVCAEVADASAAVDVAVRKRPDLCLLDVRMPGNGIAAAWEISSRVPDAKIVMLTVSRDDDDLFAALRAGAVGYLLKDVGHEGIGDALEAASHGEAALSASLVTRLLDEFRDRSARRRRIRLHDQPGQDLTSREWQVLDLLRSGATTAEIAERLVVTQATVRSHVASVLRKLRVESREELLELFDAR